MEQVWNMAKQALEEIVMGLHTLYTYHGLKELRKIQEEREVFPFIFADTKSVIDTCPETCIDISTLVYYVQTEKNNIYPAYINFSGMTEDTVVIIDAAIAEKALELFPHLFSELENYYATESATEPPLLPLSALEPCLRQKIYKYNNVEELNSIVQYASETNIPIATFSRASGAMRREFERFNASVSLAILDLTSVSYAIEDNKNLIYALEQFLASMPNVRVIAQTSRVDTLLKYFPLFLEGQDPVYELIPELPRAEESEIESPGVIKVADLAEASFETFLTQFNHNLIGHRYFKNRLQYALKNFITLNKVKEQKVFSIFLFGASGIGKTEVARLIANGLQDDCYLAKINFQNYSSQDALNSLIGSPAGYIGCDHGELSDKIQKSKVGVLLCDEFEKTTRPVFSFFLELLEEGRFTDSLAREYDLDGYIIVFTSNIPNEAEYKKIIPPELQTRFDLVCEFEAPTSSEKMEFLDLLLEKAYEKYPDQFAAINMTEEDKQQLYDFDYSGLSALRDIKRVFNNRLMDFFDSKGCLA